MYNLRSLREDRKKIIQKKATWHKMKGDKTKHEKWIEICKIQITTGSIMPQKAREIPAENKICGGKKSPIGDFSDLYEIVQYASRYIGDNVDKNCFVQSISLLSGKFFFQVLP